MEVKIIRAYTGSLCGVCLVAYEDRIRSKPHIIVIKDHDLLWKLYCNDLEIIDTNEDELKLILHEGKAYKLRYYKVLEGENEFTAVDRVNEIEYEAVNKLNKTLSRG